MAAPFPLAPPGAHQRPPAKRPRYTPNTPPTASSSYQPTFIRRKNAHTKSLTKSAPWFDWWEFETVGAALLSTSVASPSASAPSTTNGEQSQYLHQPIPPLNYGGGGFGTTTTITNIAPAAGGSCSGSGSSMSTEEALERVAVWRRRCPQRRLPHAIESTYALARVLWREQRNTNNSNSTMELCLAYSSAIIRSINGLADVLQQQRAVAASVAHLCSTQLGLPVWLVNIRHEATHQQLPSLPVLRVAATTLLQYFRSAYWDPLVQQRRDHWSTAVGLLDDYRISAALGSSTRSDTPTPGRRSGQESSTPMESTASSDLIDDDVANMSNEVEKDSDDDDGKDGTTGEAAAPAVLGTSYNRFAVLLESSKRTKKKTTGSTDDSKTAPERECNKNNVAANNNKRKQQKSSDDNADNKKLSPSSLARKYVKAKIPLDVAHGAALSCLVWGGDDDTAAPPSPLLVPPSLQEYPDTELGFNRVQKRCLPLLSALGLERPGFLSALLVHIVDAILLAQDSLMTATIMDGTQQPALLKRRLFFLGSWAEYLISRDFLAQFIINRSKPSSNTTAPGRDQVKGSSLLQLVKNAGYPLNALCDRCTSTSGMDHTDICNNGTDDCRATSSRLVRLFEEVLSDDRVPFHGVAPNVSTAVAESSSLPNDDGDSSDIPGKLSLDQIEAMLGDTDGGVSKLLTSSTTANPDQQGSAVQGAPAPSARDAWIRCESWEPCALGTIPGYPL